MASHSKERVFIADVDEFSGLWRPLYPAMQVRTFKADASIAQGQCVMLDHAELATAIGSTTAVATLAVAEAIADVLLKVIPTSTAATGEPFIGVALEAASAGDDVRVVVGGFCPKVLISTDDVAAGEAIVAAAVAGACETYAAATHTGRAPFGFALSTETDNAGYVAAWIFPTC